MPYRSWEKWEDQNTLDSLEDWWDKPGDHTRWKSLRRVLATLKAENPELSTLLDMSCGTGKDYQFCVDMEYDYTGADITPGMLDRFHGHHPNAKLELDDALNSKFHDGQFDVVLNNALLCHLPLDEVQNAINELWRITGKVMVIRLPYINKSKVDDSAERRGFVVTYFRASSVLGMLRILGADRITVHGPDPDEDQDVYVFEAWKGEESQ